MRNISGMVSLWRTLLLAGSSEQSASFVLRSVKHSPYLYLYKHSICFPVHPLQPRVQSVLNSDNGPQFEEWEFSIFMPWCLNPLQIWTPWTLTWNHMCPDGMAVLQRCPRCQIQGCSVYTSERSFAEHETYFDVNTRRVPGTRHDTFPCSHHRILCISSVCCSLRARVPPERASSGVWTSSTWSRTGIKWERPWYLSSPQLSSSFNQLVWILVSPHGLDFLTKKYFALTFVQVSKVLYV